MKEWLQALLSEKTPCSGHVPSLQFLEIAAKVGLLDQTRIDVVVDFLDLSVGQLAFESRHLAFAIGCNGDHVSFRCLYKGSHFHRLSGRCITLPGSSVAHGALCLISRLAC